MRYEDATREIARCGNDGFDKFVMIKVASVFTDIYERKRKSPVLLHTKHPIFVYELYARRSEDGQWMQLNEDLESYSECDDPRPEEDREPVEEAAPDSGESSGQADMFSSEEQASNV